MRNLREYVQNIDTLVYHANCTDGLAAAGVVLRHLAPEIWNPLTDSAPERWDTVRLVPANYTPQLPEGITGRVLFVDFCPEESQVDPDWQDWVAIDHHHSRAHMAEKYPDNVLFGDECGAVLTWRALTLNQGGEVPEYLRYVQDRDLWQWQLPVSREISASFGMMKKDPKHWAVLFEQFTIQDPFFNRSDSRSFQQLWNEGNALLRQVEQQVERCLDRVFLAAQGSLSTGVLNATSFVSEVGEAILARHTELDAACVWWLTKKDSGLPVVQMSWRSRPGTDHALLCAQMFGGGGHKAAAGARCSLERLEQLIRGEL